MSRIKKAVIPVAGQGTRFLPATKAIPKEMIPIVDTPMIQYIVEEAVGAGIEEIVFVTARHKEALENHFDHNYELEDSLEKKGKAELLKVAQKVSTMCNVVSIRQKNPMGLGHAVLTAKPVVGNEPFAVLLGDDLIDSPGNPCIGQLIKIFEQKQKSVVGVMEVPESAVSKYGIVGGKEIDPKTVEIDQVVEKPSRENAPSRLAIPGRYVLDPSIFELLENTEPGAGGEIQLTDGLLELAKTKGLLAYLFEGTRYDTGDKVGYIDATLAFSLRRPELKDSVVNLMKKHLGEV